MCLVNCLKVTGCNGELLYPVRDCLFIAVRNTYHNICGEGAAGHRWAASLFCLAVSDYLLLQWPRVGSGVVRLDRSISWPDVVEGD